jgi:homocysteine S-methyltransferase
MNLARPHFVLDLHREYVQAGAELIKTNTFLANRFRLKGDVREVNLAGARLAREAARGGFVAGSVGPLSDVAAEGKLTAFREQCSALAEGGCDAILLETFTDPTDLGLAALAGRDTGLPVIAQLAATPGKCQPVALFKTVMKSVQGVGVNCVTPNHALYALKHLEEYSGVPRSAFPSAGLPGEEAPPETFQAWIRDLVAAGARLVGGCCGAGPDHIRAAAAAVGRGR